MRSGYWRKLVDISIRIVMPEVCAGCGVAQSWICDACWKDVRAVNPGTCCSRCGYPSVASTADCPRCSEWPDGDLSIRSAFVFSGALRQSVLRMKYGHEFARAPWHAGHLEVLVRQTGWIDDIDVIVPVPLHPRKLKKRGYNQSEKLATELARRLDIDIDCPVERVRETDSQTSLGREQRRENVANAFACRQSLDGLSVMLVDDVATTCSTLRECAKACRDAGAGRVYAITLATDA